MQKSLIKSCKVEWENVYCINNMTINPETGIFEMRMSKIIIFTYSSNEVERYRNKGDEVSFPKNIF